MSVDFERLQQLEPYYSAGIETRRRLGNTSLTMLLGPTGAGKSTLIRKVETFQADRHPATWGEPGSLVTRPRCPDDPASYVTADEGTSLEGLNERIHNRSLTNYSVHPSGHIYATGPENFTYAYNLLPTMPSSVNALRSAGFASTHTVFVTVEPHDLKAGLKSREADPSYRSRINESVSNVEYALDNAADIDFVRNSHLPGGLEMAADNIIDVTLGDYDRDNTPELHVAHAMWSYLRKQQER